MPFMNSPAAEDWPTNLIFKPENTVKRQVVKRHLLSIVDLTPREQLAIVERAVRIARNHDVGAVLAGKCVGIYFRKTSTRTRTSFTVATARLGGTAVAFGPNDLQTSTGESINDTARVLSGYLDALVVRTAASIQEMKLFAGQTQMSVINAMSDNEHPTQALADLATLLEHFGSLEGLHLLYVGEGNNTASALALALSRVTRCKLTMITPEGYELPSSIQNLCEYFATRSQSVVTFSSDLRNTPGVVDAVYTTRWETTGTSKSDPDWKSRFRPFSVNEELMAKVSKPATVFMHDLPAHRGEDVTSEVLDGPQSIAFRQAQYKLYSAMAILEWIASARDLRDE